MGNTQKLPEQTVSNIAAAITKAENDPTGRYGVRSVKVNSSEEAYQVLLNSIRNNYSRWMSAGMPGKFVDFMANRWAPVGAGNDPNNLNKNWPGNVRGILQKQLSPDEYEKMKQQNLVMLFNPNVRV